MRAQILMLAVGLAGCSKLLGIDDLSGPDTGDDVPGDGSDDPDGPVVPEMVTVTGTLLRNTSPEAPLANHPISLVKMPGRVHVADGTTEGSGRYTLTAPTGGVPLDAYVEVAGSSGLDIAPSMLHFVGPLFADVQIDLSLNRITSLNSSASSSGDPRRTGTAIVRVFVAGANGTTPIAGAIVSFMPSVPVKYLADVVLSNGTATTDRGVAFAFNALVGANTVSANLAGNVVTRSFPIFAGDESHYVPLQLQ